MSSQDYQNRLEDEVERARQDERRSWVDRPEELIRADFDRMRVEASSRGGYARCIQGEVVIDLPFTRALGPGHIYSEAGLREYRITGVCEFHFDQWFKEESNE